MSSIKELIQSIEAADSSFDEKLAAINKMEETLVAMRQQEEQAVQDNVDLIVEAIKVMENKVTAQLEVAKSIVPEKGDKGDKGERGLDGRQGIDGKNGLDGRDGKNGIDGKDGVSVADAKIDFDGSLIISLSTGQEINVGEVVAPDLAEKIKVISTMSTNGAVGIKDEGTSITGGVKTINFVGATVTATNSGDDVTVNVSAGTGTVTSVAATVPSFLSVSGSPITTTGTLAITLSGTALPVVNGGTGVTTSTGSGNVVLSTSPSLTTPVLGTPTSGTLSNCTVDGTDAVGFRNVPVNSQSAAYTLVLADSGKTILHPSSDANARTFTIPSNASVAYPVGTIITFINMTSQVVTIAITTDTMNLSPAGTTGSRSLAQYGSATALKITSTNWLISGSGLT